MMRLLFTLLLLSLYFPLFSQISEGGMPPSFRYDNTKALQSELTPYIIELKQDINKLKKEDEITDSYGLPSRVASVIPAAINLTESGTWTALPNGDSICRLRIISPDALGIILSYSQFLIPEGGKLFIYNRDKDQLLGAYTHSTNPKGVEFSTEIVYGDELTLEYMDAGTGVKPRIEISDIGYAYNHVYDYTKVTVEGPGFNASGSCQVNVNCSEGDNWQQQKKGVTRTYSKMGMYWYRCSGSLINNTNEDYTPYYLSAAHCFFDSGYAADFNTIQFYFHYETAGCEKESKPTIETRTKSVIGAQLMAASLLNGGSDGVLLKLNDEIPMDYDVCFNGWNRTNIPADQGVVIHHPQGDVKKISTYTSPLRIGTYIDNIYTGATHAHWVVNYTATENGFGTTEGGSSGSPIFNQDGLIVGSLTGGSSSCGNNRADDFYGKLWYHWDQATTPNSHMKQFLDPKNTGVTQLQRLNTIKEIELEADILNLKEQTALKVNILNGNEVYTVSSSDSQIATAVVTENAQDKFINITAIGIGTARITVTDQKNKKAEIVVNVYPKEADPIVIKRVGGDLSFELISTENDAIREVKILDLMGGGRILYHKKGLNDIISHHVNTSTWNRGVYVVVINTKNGYSVTKKITWQK